MTEEAVLSTILGLLQEMPLAVILYLILDRAVKLFAKAVEDRERIIAEYRARDVQMMQVMMADILKHHERVIEEKLTLEKPQ